MKTVTKEIGKIVSKSDIVETVLAELIDSGFLDNNPYETFFMVRTSKSEDFLQDFIKSLLTTDRATLLIDSINIVAIEAINLLKVAIQTKNEMLTNYFVDNFEEIAKVNSYNVELLNEFREFGIDKERLIDIQEDAVNELSGNNFLKFIQSANENEGLKLEFDYNSFTRHLLKKEKDIMQDELLLQMISRLIQELCEHEGVDVTQIKFGGSGYFNTNLKIGELVLKIAPGDRKTVKIKNDKRIIKPILRQQTNIEERKNVPNLFIEIQNIVEANWYEGLSKEEIKETLYTIFSELMDRGLRWTDIKKENVGRLIKPNKENFYVEGEEQISSDYSASYYGEKPNEVLEPGELVIIDTDYIYESKLKKDIRIPKDTFYEEFLARYQGEREEQICDSIKQIIINENYTLPKKQSTLGRLWSLAKDKFKGR